MKHILTASILAAAAVASAIPSSTIVQSKTYSILGNSGTENLTFNQFNSALGTLTGVYVESTGTLTGSFLVSKSGGGSVTVTSSSDEMYLTFAASGPSLTSSKLTPISTTPDSGATGTTFNAAASPVTFTVDSSQVLTLASTDLTADWASWFTGNGTRTVEVSQGAGVTTSGANYTTDFANLALGGSVTLTYYYTAAPVPEASTYGIALGGLALVGAVIRRRRSAK